MKRKEYWLVLLFASHVICLSAQSPTFLHLNKSDGLSHNTVTTVVSDKNGLLWIGTCHGLNSYDGYTVKSFIKKDYPALAHDHITRMVCDEKNRIWIQSEEGDLTLLNENGQFETINPTLNNKRLKIDYLLPVSHQPMFISDGHLYGLQDEKTRSFAPLKMKDEPLLSNAFERINKWDKDKLLFTGSNMVFLFDVRELRTSGVAKVPGAVAAARVNDSSALVTTSNGNKLLEINFSSGSIRHYGNLKDQNGDSVHPLPGSIENLQEQLFLITSPSAGVYLFDADKKQLLRYQHDLFDNRTLSNNHTLNVFKNDDGYVFVAAFGMGLDYFKLGSPLTSVKTIFKDSETGGVYGEYVNCITEDVKGNIWLAGSGTFIKQNKKSGEIKIYRPERNKETDPSGGIRSLYVDKYDRIWAGYRNGLIIFDKDLNIIKHLNHASGLTDSCVNRIIESPDGDVWISTAKGICFIDPQTFDVKIPEWDSSLFWAMGKKCNTTWFRNAEEVWIGTWDGALKVNLTSGKSEIYTTKSGLAFNEVIGFADDKYGNIYIGTRFGLNILEPAGSLRYFKNINNIWSIDCHALVQDHSGNIWFSSNDYLASYSPTTQKFNVYDEKAGINPSGFRFYSAYSTSGGELIFGSHLGITSFKPESIQPAESVLSVFIHEMVTADSIYHAIPGSIIKLPHFTQSVSFSFSAINFSRGKNIFYQYRLDGVDEGWVETTSGQRITYHNLQPGNYRFFVNASENGLNWTGASNSVAFYIATPWWQQIWFRLSSIVILVGIAGFIVSLRIRRSRQQRENLEAEKAINYLATSLHEQRTVESILWDVTKNCISQLHFEDCVIYLEDQDRNVLVQKAAWGPKTTDEDMIVNPIEIPIGQGIVGCVFKTGIAEIVHDTSKDDRYIIDDASRLSEITVPIMYEGKVLGIIDSEHSKRGFFKQKHLSILTTIASMCAQKMIRAEAEKEKQEAQLATLRHEREAVNAQLKSLRLQMNPHFLFNSLNAIQQMILAGEDRSATRYLSKFSRLLRLVLLHSDKENITLKEELETLNLYVELESLRFNESFHYEMICDEGIDPEEIKVPVMLIQPFVENAIWHGLLHKKGDRYLKIEFSEGPDENISCVIEDNGIGREAAQRINNGSHTKKGIAVAKERLKTRNIYHMGKSEICIDDIKDDSGNAAGTRVILVLQ